MLFPVVTPRNDAASNTPAVLPGTPIAPAVSLAPAASTDPDAPNTTPGAPDSIVVLLVPSELSAQSAPSSALTPSASFALACRRSESPPAFRLPPRRPARRLPSLPFQIRRVSLRRDELFLPPPALFRCLPEPDAEVAVAVLPAAAAAAAAADVGSAPVSSTFDEVIAPVLSVLTFLSVSFKSFPSFRSFRPLAEESGLADKSVPWM